MKSRKLVAFVVAAFALGGLLAFLLRDDDQETPGSTAASPRSTASTSATSSPASGAASAPEPSSPSGSESADTTAGPGGSGPRIVTSRQLYFGLPFETIRIAGRYLGVQGSRQLRVEVRNSAGWTPFPLPVVTEPNGRFRAYVELGFGQHQLRIVDPAGGTTSQVLTARVF